MSTTEETSNGEASVLAKIRADHKKAGGKDPSKAEAAKMVSAWQTAHSKVEAAEKALEAAKAEESGAVLALAKAFGAKSLKIGGVVHDFASRGETIFFRRKSTDVVEL